MVDLEARLKGLTPKQRDLLLRRLGREGAAAPPAVIPRRPPGGELPLSLAQERMWFLHQLEPESPAYNIASALHLRGVLDLTVFARSLAEIVRRHEALRTVFVLAGGQPRQRVLSEAPPVFALADLSALPEGVRAAERDRVCQAEAGRPFDLARGPLLRILLVRLGPAEMRAVFTLHHIVGDGWSVSVMVREFAALYQAFVAGRPSPLPELPIQYGDYSEWQREQLRGETLERDLEHWRQALAGAPALIELPADRPRPAVQRFHGRLRLDAVDAGLARRFQDLCRSEGATLFMGLLAAFQALLARHGAGPDLVVGTPVAGRGRRELEGMIGLFLNTLPLRGDLAGDPDVRELLARTRRATLAAFSHQALPFGRLVEALVSERNLGAAPIYQVLLVLQSASRERLSLPGVEVEQVRLQEEGVKLDLSLSVEEEADGRLILRWPFNLDLFDPATVGRLSQRLQVLLGAMADDPAWRLSELPLLTAAETWQLREWNATAAVYPDATLHGLLAAQAARTPDRVAVACAGRTLTYRALDAAANRLAGRLRGLGVGPESLVGVCAERSLEMVVALLAVLKAGGAYLPLDPDYPAERLGFMLEDARVAAVLVQEHLRGVLPARGAPEIPLDGVAEAGGDVPAIDGGAGPGHLAYVIYTSGSTGRPKGAMNAHRGIVNRLLWMQERYGLGEDDRVLQKTPFSFDVSVWEFFWPLLAGARLVMARPGGHRDSAYLVETILAEGITTLHFVPSMLQVFLEAPGVERCVGLRRVLCSGEALPYELERRAFARLPRAGLHNLYGPTEAAVDVTSWACEPSGVRGAVPIGRPVANTRIHIADRELRPVPMGVPGELLIGGAQVGRGYLSRPALTAERFVPDPLAGAAGARLYRTGDLARCLADGAVEFLGRLDHQVKVRGLRIELGEIEAALAALPAVREAVVVARAEGGAVGAVNLVAYATPREGGPGVPPLDEVRRELGRSLPDYMLPSALVALDAMPLTASGKVDRKALPAPERAAATPAAWEAPRTALEGELARMWSAVLGGVEEGTIGIHDSFFQLGGNSITGAIFINQLQERLGEIVHVVVLFDAPTVAGLAAHLAAEYPRTVRRIWGEETLEAYGAPGERRGRRVDEALLAEVRRLLPSREPGPPAAVRNPRAVFLLSPPRSGSTLLRVLLAGHPGLFAPPELELLHFADLRERRDAFTGRNAFRLEGLPRAVMEIRACGPEEAQALVASWEEAAMPTRELYRRLQEWLGDRLLVDKTPTYAWSPGALREAEAAFDSPFYIHLLRHPYGMIRSFEEARIDQIFFDAEPPCGRRELAEASWVLACRNTLELLAEVPADRQVTVRYEDLVRDPETELRRICAALGLAYDPAMAEPYRDRQGRMTDGLHRESRMLGDVKLLQHAGVDAAAADRWREWLDEDFLGEPARALAAGLGYETEPAVRPGWVSIPRRPADAGPVPLSFSQERMWFLHQLDPGSSVYNVCGAFALRGTVDAAVLERCFAEVVRRHEALRTTFAVVDGRLVQIVGPAAGPSLPRVDLSALPSAARGAEAVRLAEADAALPFDLLRGPVCRFTLLRLEPAEHVLLLNIHHACSDGWSIRILARELAALYRAFLAGQPSPLPELPIQYPDFALWQRETLRGEALEAEIGWWRRRLAGELPALRLPADRRRESARGFQELTETVEVAPALAVRLEELARRHSASLYMVLLTAWKGLLVRLTGEVDVLIGAPTAGRTRPEIEALIGFFLNTLVLRTDLSGDPTFGQALSRVRETTLGAFAHQAIPLQMVLQAAQPEREWAKTAPFQAMFLFQNFPGEELALPGLTFAPLGTGHEVQDLGTAIFEVGLTLQNAPGGGLLASVTANGFLFDRATIARLLERYVRLLAAAAADPGRSLWSYDLLSPEERPEVLAAGQGLRPREGSGDGELGAEPSSVLPPLSAEERARLMAWSRTPGTWALAPVEAGTAYGLFVEQARLRPEAVALVSGERRMSYGELARRSGSLAAALRRLGVGPEVRVGLSAERSPELVVGILGILRAGGTLVPLDPAHPAERLTLLLEDSGLAVVVTQRELPVSGPATLRLDEVEDADWTDPEIPREALAYVIYTSGSTGRPKGVGVSHANIVPMLRWSRETFGLGEGRRVLQSLSYAFDFGLWEILTAVVSGAALHIPPAAETGDAEAFARRALAEGIDTVHATPSFFRAVAETGVRLPDLRVLHLGGEALSRTGVERLAAAVGEGCTLYNGYGPTEATVNSLLFEIGRPGNLRGGERTPIGRPSAENAVYVVDPLGDPVPVGVSGELWVGGPGVARGYLGRPGLTAEKFIPDGFGGEPGGRLYRTGDLVRWLPDGTVEFLGRIDDQVKIRGFRIEPGEIEAVLRRHPQVREAVVVPREQPGGAVLVAYVVADEAGLGASELRDFLHERLPAALVPSAFVCLADLPLTPTGKVDRRALPAPERTRDAGRARVAPRTPAEETVAAIWGELLGIDGVGATDNFFELGGHSLLLPQVLHRLRTAFQVEIPLRVLLDEPTVEGLALTIEEILLEEIERQLAETEGDEGLGS